MFYFGISNKDPLNDPFIKDFNLFPFIRKENLANSIKIEEEEMVMDNTDYHFCSVPVLSEHRNNVALKNIWDGIKDGDIITNRGLKRALAAEKKNQKIERKVVISAGKEKLIYLITRGEKRKLPSSKFNSGYHAETQVFEYPLKGYTIYKYMKCFNKELKCFEHYTCEVDGFIKDERNAYVPVEFKCFRYLKINDFVVDRS